MNARLLLSLLVLAACEAPLVPRVFLPDAAVRDAPRPRADADSDHNGILDVDETPTDGDGDGHRDAVDLDDDGDGIADVIELAGAPPPPDHDGDGTPDHHDRDADGDSVLDATERELDTDRDGTADYLDDDSDGDGLSDAIEAGDARADTDPVDTDGDGTDDFRDPDSDADGLSDRDEVSLFATSPTRADTDGDGASDLVELGAATDALAAADSPQARGDFVFVVPYEAAPTPPRDTLAFRTSIRLADLYFLFDRSGSMAGEIGALRRAVGSLVDGLACVETGVPCARDADCAGGTVCGPTATCVEDPALDACIASLWTGGGTYVDETYRNLASLGGDPTVTSAALAVTTGGSTEALYRAAWGVADPGAAPGTEVGCTGTLDCPAFRSDAVRILVAFTDEDSDGLETAATAGAALAARGITLLGVWSGDRLSTMRTDLVDLATASGSLDRAGRPLVFDGLDDAVVPAVTLAVREIAEGVPLRVTIEAGDEPDDAGDALAFIDRLEVSAAGADCAAVASTDVDGDGVRETYPAATPGTRLCWDVVPRTNTTVAPERAPRVFRARLTVRGDGSPLDSRVVWFLVPPVPPTVEIPM